jgi:hypothetical protein
MSLIMYGRLLFVKFLGAAFSVQPFSAAGRSAAFPRRAAADHGGGSRGVVTKN